MRGIYKTGVLSLFLAVFISCESKNDRESVTNENQNNVDSEYENMLGVVSNADTIKIIVEFSECGEWGGHREWIHLFRESNGKIHAHLKVDTVSCDRIITKYDRAYQAYYSDLADEERVIRQEKWKSLNNKDEQLISRFISRLLKLYLSHNYLNRNEDSLFIYRGAGKVIQVMNTNSTLDFTFYNSDNYSNTKYSKMRDEIFGDANIVN